MNPIERVLQEMIGASGHKDSRTLQTIEAAILRGISRDTAISGCHDMNLAFEKIVARKITDEKFAAALRTIAAAVLEMLPIIEGCGKVEVEVVPNRDNFN